MFVRDWMTTKIFTVEPGDGVYDALHTMKEQGIKHLPVVVRGRLKGILSDRDIRTFSPSKATGLDVYELHYLLASTKVKEIMRTEIVTTAADAPVEEAARTMLDQDIGCLPVLDRKELAGIISDRDIFRALVDITGIRHGGHRITVTLPDTPGSIRDVTTIIRKHGFRLESVLSSYERVKRGKRRIVVRTKGAGNFRPLKEELTGTYRDVSIRKG